MKKNITFFAYMFIIVGSLCSFSNKVILTVASYEPIYFEQIPEKQRYLNLVPSQYKNIVLTISEKLNIPVKIIYNLVQKESNWRESAVGKNRDGSFDVGLTQINSSNFEYFYWKILKQNVKKDFNYVDFYKNPEVNLWTGFLYLRWLVDYYNDDVEKALIAYNCGLGKVNRNAIPKSSIQYAKFILTN